MACVPLQRYFLKDIGHHHESCDIYRKMEAAATTGATKDIVSIGTVGQAQKKSVHDVCLACEMDKLFLRYLGSAKGLDVLSAVTKVAPLHQDNSVDRNSSNIKGEPLIAADILTAAWKCGGMNHLAGYQQRDAHEFLHGFLEILGKDTRMYRDRVYKIINTAKAENAVIVTDKNSHNGKSSDVCFKVNSVGCI
jgi:hypothetical protein